MMSAVSAVPIEHALRGDLRLEAQARDLQLLEARLSALGGSILVGRHAQIAPAAGRRGAG